MKLILILVFLGLANCAQLGLFKSLFSKTTPRMPNFTPLDIIPIQHRPELESRRQLLIQMAQDAWKYSTTGNQPQLTEILPAMSTLWLMGLKHEFNRGKEIIELELDYNLKKGEQKYDENLLRDGPGPLLSLFILTGDEFFLDKAQDLAETSQIPELIPENLDQLLKFWNSNRLELRYLSDLTGDKQYWNKIRKVEDYLGKANISPEYYKQNEESLAVQVKSFIQASGFQSSSTHDLLYHFSILDQFLESGYLQYYPQLNLTQVNPSGSMSIQQCLYGSTLALGATVLPLVKSSVPEARLHWELAESLTETCRLARDANGLPSGEFKILPDGTIHSYGSYHLQPQITESFFVLYRLTGHEKYREYAWTLTQAINQSGRTSTGHFIKPQPAMSMRRKFPEPDSSYLLGSTLKFLYLTAASDDLLPLDKWIFTASGQPLPICGRNSAYQRSLCSKY